MGWAGHEPDYGGSFKAAVPNIFGTRDRFWFRGNNFFTARGEAGGEGGEADEA